MRSFLIIPLFFLIFPMARSQSITIYEWEIFEQSYTSKKELPNPYVDGLIENEKPYFSAVFTGISGEAEGNSYQVPGFWDGNNIWRIRFAPPFPGKWQYITESVDQGLNRKKGDLFVQEWTEDEKIDNPTRRGIIQVADKGTRQGRYFIYFDGTPFLWIGDTWWNWTKEEIAFESFKKLVDTRSIQQFSVGQLFFAGNGWGKSSSLLDASYQHPEIEHIQKIEKMIQYANEKGITVWIHAWWSRDKIDETIGEENMKRWWRYVVHRLQAYNVIWVLAGEYNMHNYGGLDINFWNKLGNMIKSEDPYDRIVSVHPTPPGWAGGADAPQWSTAEAIHSQDWLDYNQSQPGHGRWRNELIPEIVIDAYQRNPAKPIVVTEPWYEFIEGNPTDMDIRFGAWSAILNGAAGHSYAGGHVWRAHLPESPSGVGVWPMDTSFDINTLYYKGAKSLSYLSSYLQKITWWQLEPHPEYVIENPSPHCSAIPGNVYLAYLRYGGTVKIDLTAGRDQTFQYEWIDLVNQKKAKEGEIKGGKIVSMSPPEDYPGVLNFKDWLLHIFLK